MNGFLTFVRTNKLDGYHWDFQIFVMERAGTGAELLTNVSDWEDWIRTYADWGDASELPDVVLGWFHNVVIDWRNSLNGQKPRNLRPCNE